MKAQSGTNSACAKGNLSAIGLLSCLAPEQLHSVESECSWLGFRPGSVIIERGEMTDEVFFLLDGEMQVLSFADCGRAVAFAVLHKGDYFGELAAIDGKPRSATVVAKTECQVASLSGGEFVRLVTNHAPITILLLNKLAGIIRTSDERIINQSILGAEQRICLELLRLARPNPAMELDEFEIYPVPTQISLSRDIGVTRETVARIFGHLTQEGIIQRKSNVLYIRDKRRLEGFAFSVKPTSL